MPVSITNLKRNRRTITIPVGEDTLTITYQPSGFTPETEDRLRSLADDQRGGAALVALLADTLVEWDLLDENGKPLRIDKKTLEGLPLLFLSRLVQAIAEDLNPNASSGGTSAAGSLQTGS